MLKGWEWIVSGGCFLSLAYLAYQDIKKRELTYPPMMLLLAAGIDRCILRNTFFPLLAATVVLAAFVLAIIIKQQELRIGGGDILVFVALTPAVGIFGLLCVTATALIFIVLALCAQAIYHRRRPKFNVWVPLLPYLCAGYAIWCLFELYD